MRLLFILLFLKLSVSANAQKTEFTKPDYQQIKKDIEDASSPLYYPTLLSRLASYDTTLTTKEYTWLYYGYFFHKDYEPYWRFDKEDELLKYYRRVEPKDYAEVIKLTSESIAEFPFDLRAMNYMAYVYHLKGDEVMARKVVFRFYSTLNAIKGTGDGETCETAYHVISTSHEYVILNVLKFKSKMQSLTGNCDYLTFVENDRNVKGLYFDVSKLFEKNREIFDKKK